MIINQYCCKMRSSYRYIYIIKSTALEAKQEKYKDAIFNRKGTKKQSVF